VEIRKGIPVSPGYVVREAFVLDSEELRIPQRFISPPQVESEVARFEKALEVAQAEIEELRDQAAESVGPEYGAIFDFHKAILEDRRLRKEIETRIRNNKFTAEYAVSRALRKQAKSLGAVENPFFSQRVDDIYDIEKRVLRSLIGERRESIKNLEHEVVVIARDLTPSQTASLEKTRVLGFATDAGGRTSHTAIVARALGIPAVVGLGAITADVSGGDTVIVDGTNGLVIIAPDEHTLNKYRTLERGFKEFQEKLTLLHYLPTETLDGYRLKLLANIEFPEEVDSALDAGADGVGLYRTEFLFTDSSSPPDEDMQFHAYHEALRMMDDRPVVIRTLDLGADKVPVDSPLQRESNPFLGCRSIRYSLLHIDMFKTQLRAMLRASAFGNLKIMLPMISSVDEVRRTKVILSDVMEELREQSISFNPDIEVGVMVEVPSAALTVDILAREVDFLSIGTNDLIQYSLAVDRINERVAELYQPVHPAILRLLKETIQTGRRYGIEVAMCGEMSAEVVYTILLLGMGLENFSVTPVNIPEVKKVIRSVTMRESRETAEIVLHLSDAKSAESFLRARTHKIVPWLA
jgi:phosphotransferase system enzyme I (PtsI)